MGESDSATSGIVVLISGEGTNLQAILDQAACAELGAPVSAVISNRPGVRGLHRAREAGVPDRVVDHTAHAGREAFDAALMAEIDAWQPRLVVLAGFMRILTDAFVRHYRGRMLNIHPSLLPLYPGLNTHARALAAGDRWHGATVHFVTEDLDSGPPVLQARVPVLDGDTPDTLAARVREQEHRMYPLAIRWFIAGRLELSGNRAMLDGEPLPPSGYPMEDLNSEASHE